MATLQRLPGIGARTAERLALSLLDWPVEHLERFGAELATLRSRVVMCSQCGNLAEGDLCAICRDRRRDTQVICVVEQANQIPVIERSGGFHGLYHVLGGRLMPLEGRGPEQLRLQELKGRLETGEVRELILATSSDVEGEATAAYINEEFAEAGVDISRIAAGVPVGADLSYADAATVAMALSSRRPFRS